MISPRNDAPNRAMAGVATVIAALGECVRACRKSGGDGGESNSPSRILRLRPTTSVSDHFRQPRGRGSAPSPLAQSRAPRSGLTPDYATLIRAADLLIDASTAHRSEAASTLTLPPKRRGRESTAWWQVLRFAAGLTRPD